MTDLHEILARIRAQADAATPGPWKAEHHAHWVTGRHYATEISGVIELSGDGEGGVHDPLNGEFIAAARTNVPRLVDALEAVLEVHAPVPCTITDGTGVTEGTVCDSCMTHEWPCSTVKAITTTLNGDNV